jgi:hypothetical protein
MELQNELNAVSQMVRENPPLCDAHDRSAHQEAQ